MAGKDKEAWWEAYTRIISPQFAAFLADESKAKDIVLYCRDVVPGLLQTESYAYAIMEKFLLFSGNTQGIRERVKLRMQRQWHVLEGSQPPTLRAIITDQVLHRKLGGIEVLHEQLLHLADMATLPHITIQVIPLPGYEPLFSIDPSSCILFDFQDADQPNSLYQEESRPPGENLYRSTSVAEVAFYQQAFEETGYNRALNPEMSLKRIRARITEIERQKQGTT